jgi:hypothetical protein
MFNQFFDRFKAGDFEPTSNMLVVELKRIFFENFGLSLRVYKGRHLADEKLMLSQVANLDGAGTTKLKIKASMTIGEVEEAFKKIFNITVQISNEFETYLINNKYTLGQAARKEDVLDHCKSLGFKSIEDWLATTEFSSLDDYYRNERSKKSH